MHAEPASWLLVLSVFTASWAPALVCQAETPDTARIETLTHRLLTDRSYKIRLLAAQKLSRLCEGPTRADPRVVHALLLGLEDRHAIVRAMSARALGEHGAQAALSPLAQLSRHDPDRAVRQQAREATKALRLAAQAPPPTRQLGITLGSLALTDSNGGAQRPSAAFHSRLSDAVRHRLQPYRPSLAAPNPPHLRMDVRIERLRSADKEVRFEVSVVLVELPQAHLRHSAKATARAQTKGSSPAGLEDRVAMEAVQRAVDDALATAVASRAGYPAAAADEGDWGQ